MLAAVFISDLHLHPEETLINARFHAFIEWIAGKARSLYILGDLFHAWPGDDGLDDWSLSIAKKLRSLREKQVQVYYLHGNRDFLLGKTFAQLAGMEMLRDPTVIYYGKRILLSHGDRYCTKDKAHQALRRLTRNRYFPPIFLRLPFKFRKQLVDKVREYSQMNTKKSAAALDVVQAPMIKQLQQQKATILIRGHTHKPGLINYEYNKVIYSEYVLSDWDNKPTVLTYDESQRFNLIQPID